MSACSQGKCLRPGVVWQQGRVGRVQTSVPLRHHPLHYCLAVVRIPLQRSHRTSVHPSLPIKWCKARHPNPIDSSVCAYPRPAPAARVLAGQAFASSSSEQGSWTVCIRGTRPRAAAPTGGGA